MSKNQETEQAMIIEESDLEMSTKPMKPNLDVEESIDKDLEEQVKRNDLFIEYLTLPGYEFNAFPMGGKKQGGVSGKTVFSEYIPTPLIDPTTKKFDMYLLYYYIGNQGKYKVHIRRFKHKGDMKNTFAHMIDITAADFSRAYEKYKWIDIDEDLSQQAPTPQFGNFQHTPQFGQPYQMNQYDNHYQPQQYGQFDTMRMFDMFAEKMDKLIDKYERRDNDKGIIDADVIKLAMINNGSESMQKVMQLIASMNSNKGDNSYVGDIMNAMNNSNQNTMQLLQTLITTQASKGNDTTQLAELMNIVKTAKELTGDGGDKGMMETVLNSPVIAQAAGQLIPNLFSGGNNQQQKQINNNSNNGNEQIITAITQMGNALNEMQKKINYLEQVKLPDNNKPQLQHPELKLKDNQKQIPETDIQKALEKGDIEMFKNMPLAQILIAYLEDKIDLEQTVSDFYEAAENGDEPCAGLINTLSNDPGSKDSLLKQLSPMLVIFGKKKDDAIKKISMLIDFFIMKPVIDILMLHVRGEKSIDYVINKLELEADDNQVIDSFLADLAPPSEDDKGNKLTAEQIDVYKAEKLLAMAMFCKSEDEAKKMTDLINTYISSVENNENSEEEIKDEE